MSLDRRGFLRRTVSGTVLGATGLATVTGSALAAEEMTINGKIHRSSADAAAGDGLLFNNAWDGRGPVGTLTESDGSFEVTVPPDIVEGITTHSNEDQRILFVGYYEFPHAKNHNPDVYALTHVEVESGAERDLGLLELPAGLELDVRIIERGNGPVEGATVRVASQYTGRGKREHNWGRGDVETNERGLVDWDGLENPGMEMVDLVHLWVWPPDAVPGEDSPAEETHIQLQNHRHMETIVI